MKVKNLLLPAITVFLLTACKKDKLQAEKPVPNEEAALEYAKDSVAYTIDGVAYSQSKYSSFYKASNHQPHSKIDSIVNNSYYISGRTDSVLYSRSFLIYNETRNFEITFIKTYSKESMVKTFLWKPKDIMDLYAAGSRTFVLDYERDNIQNGVAFKFFDGFRTYGSESFAAPPQLNPDAQKDSKFEITSLKKLSSGTYILEAKFNASLFNDKSDRKKIENGYLRLVISRIDSVF